MYNFIFGAVLSLMAVTSAQAALIDQGNMVYDPDTGLEWLDLTETLGMSYNTALTTFQGDGWRYATEAQYEGVFDTVFNSGYSGNSQGFMDAAAGTDPYIASEDFITLFGITFAPSFKETFGLYEDAGGVIRVGGAKKLATYALLYRDYTADFESNRTVGSQYAGVYLVRDAALVPSPSTLLLLGPGIIGLGLYRQKASKPVRENS